MLPPLHVQRYAMQNLGVARSGPPQLSVKVIGTSVPLPLRPLHLPATPLHCPVHNLLGLPALSTSTRVASLALSVRPPLHTSAWAAPSRTPPCRAHSLHPCSSTTLTCFFTRGFLFFFA